MNDRPLSARQLRFVEEYLIDQVGRAAYIRAGYKARGDAADAAASRLLRDVRVRKLVDEGLAALSNEAGLSQEWVRKRLKEEAEGKMPDSTSSSRVRATELIGKHFKMFTDKVEVEDVTQYSERQLDSRLAQLLRKAGTDQASGGEGEA
jgi:phage terminase small subunit